MADNLFEGLPPPSANPLPPSEHEAPEPVATNIREVSPVPAPKPILKSALKRSNPTESETEGDYFFLKYNIVYLLLFS